MGTLNVLFRLIADVEDRFDRLKYHWKRRTGFNPIRLAAYRGHGAADRVYLRGRVLEDRGVRPPSETDSVLKNVFDMYRRFASNEIPDAAVSAVVDGERFETTTNREGYFRLELPLADTPGAATWRSFRLTAHIENDNRAHADVEVLLVGRDAEFGVISDIDDTILQTGATRFLAMLRQTVAENAKTRRPFEGVSAFYSALRDGNDDGSARNPIFYVSSSAWNLYDFLVDFMAHQAIPKGPLFLRDLGVERDKFIKGRHAEHKLSCVRHIMRVHGDLDFVLIGDSGQDDPMIYRQVVDEFPNRVRAIYIRDVTKEGDVVVGEIARELDPAGVPVLLAPDTLAAADHAADLGLIPRAAVDAVRADWRRDESAPAELETLMKRRG